MNRILLLVSGILLVVCFGLYSMWKTNQQALECVAYVHEGIDTTGKGENNCTNPSAIPR